MNPRIRRNSQTILLKSNTLVGQYINLGSEIQQSVFSELFLEMKVQSCTDRIKEADISNPDSILLVTRDGYTVGLGNRNNLHAKIRAMLVVLTLRDLLDAMEDFKR